MPRARGSLRTHHRTGRARQIRRPQMAHRQTGLPDGPSDLRALQNQARGPRPPSHGTARRRLDVSAGQYGEPMPELPLEGNASTPTCGGRVITTMRPPIGRRAASCKENRWFRGWSNGGSVLTFPRRHHRSPSDPLALCTYYERLRDKTGSWSSGVWTIRRQSMLQREADIRRTVDPWLAPSLI